VQRAECYSCLPSVVKNLNYCVVQVAGGGEGGAEGGVLIMLALCGEKFELLCGAGCGWRGRWCRGLSAALFRPRRMRTSKDRPLPWRENR
jgi:hypothetical protein